MNLSGAFLLFSSCCFFFPCWPRDRIYIFGCLSIYYLLLFILLSGTGAHLNAKRAASKQTTCARSNNKPRRHAGPEKRSAWDDSDYKKGQRKKTTHRYIHRTRVCIYILYDNNAPQKKKKMLLNKTKQKCWPWWWWWNSRLEKKNIWLYSQRKKQNTDY